MRARRRGARTSSPRTTGSTSAATRSSGTGSARRCPAGRPGDRSELGIDAGANPPGRYRLALDLVAEHRAWFGELGSATRAEIEVVPRRPRRRHRADVNVRRLRTAPDWERPCSRSTEGYAVVAARDRGATPPPQGSAPWAPGPGRAPASRTPALPVGARGIELERLPDVEGPAFPPARRRAVGLRRLARPVFPTHPPASTTPPATPHTTECRAPLARGPACGHPAASPTPPVPDRTSEAPPRCPSIRRRLTSHPIRFPTRPRIPPLSSTAMRSSTRRKTRRRRRATRPPPPRGRSRRPLPAPRRRRADRAAHRAAASADSPSAGDRRRCRSPRGRRAAPRASRGSASRKNHGRSSAASRCSTSRKTTFAEATASAMPGNEHDDPGRDRNRQQHGVARRSRTIALTTISPPSSTANGTSCVATTENATSWRGKRTFLISSA